MAIRGGIVLCGGQSQRMGQPKAWLPFGPELLLQRVVRLLGTVVDRVVVVAASGQELPELPAQIEVVRDSASEEGPLRGLASGLAALPGSVDLVCVSATDTPFLRPAWYEALANRIGVADLIIPREGSGRLHPLAAIYRRGPTLAAAEKLLATGSFRLTDLIEILPGRLLDTAALAEVDHDWSTLRNLNTPAEYQQAIHDAGLIESPP